MIMNKQSLLCGLWDGFRCSRPSASCATLIAGRLFISNLFVTQAQMLRQEYEKDMDL